MPHSALRVLGEKGRVLVEQQFTWDVVAAQFMEIYADLTGRHA
jgi:glycosyltransferase involved in cell wall biosynthesis